MGSFADALATDGILDDMEDLPVASSSLSVPPSPALMKPRQSGPEAASPSAAALLRGSPVFVASQTDNCVASDVNAALTKMKALEKNLRTQATLRQCNLMRCLNSVEMARARTHALPMPG